MTARADVTGAITARADVGAELARPEVPSPCALAFDREAEDYDERFNSLAATQTIREWLWREMRSAFPPGSAILDIGCGTGDDAAALAEHGARVIGIDVSPAMIARARAKHGSRAEFRACDVRALDLQEGARHEFDGILSNFGALNCLDSLDPIRQIADCHLHAGGTLFLVLINRWYLRELARFELRRLHPSGSPVRCGDRQIALHYHAPRHLRWPGYSLTRIVALASWSRADIQTRWPLNRFGDHYLAVLEKNRAPRGRDARGLRA